MISAVLSDFCWPALLCWTQKIATCCPYTELHTGCMQQVIVSAYCSCLATKTKTEGSTSAPRKRQVSKKSSFPQHNSFLYNQFLLCSYSFITSYWHFIFHYCHLWSFLSFLMQKFLACPPPLHTPPPWPLADETSISRKAQDWRLTQGPPKGHFHFQIIVG